MDYVHVMCVAVVCPMAVSLLMLCEDVGVSFSSGASKLSSWWHVLWNVAEKWVVVACKSEMVT